MKTAKRKWLWIVLGLILWAVLWTFLDLMISHYRLLPLFQYQRESIYQFKTFYDITQDGFDDEIMLRKDEYKPNINIKTSNNEIFQYNLLGEWVKGITPMFIQLDSGAMEFVTITHKDSIVYAEVFTFQDTQKPQYIFELFEGKIIGNDDLSVGGYQTYDLNGDGKLELIFLLSAGYGIIPRRLYVIDFGFKSVIHSSDRIGAFCHNPVVFDLDNDGLHEIIVGSSSPDNVHDTLAFDVLDEYSSLLVFDQDLSLINIPIKQECKTCSVTPALLDDKLYVVAYNQDKLKKSTIYQWINDGFIEIVFAESKVYRSLHQLGDNNLVMTGDIWSRSFSFRHLESNELVMEIPIGAYLQTPTTHFFRSGLDYITFKENDRLVRVNETLDKEYIFWEDDGAFTYQEGRLPDGIKVVMHSADRIFELELVQNPLRNWLPFISMLNVGLMAFVSWFIYQFFIYRNASRRQQLYELQLQSLKNQIDPHFTFNLLGSIKLLMMKQEFAKAEEQFDLFIKMLRRSVMNAEKISNDIVDELELADQYLKLESERLNGRFQYQIENHLTEAIQVPKLLIQTHLENAVKHGVYHLEDRKGLIKVLVTKHQNSYSIIITDNGVGRAAAAKKKTRSTGKGVKITFELCDLYQKYYKCKVRQTIEDLNPGTKVIIEIGN